MSTLGKEFEDLFGSWQGRAWSGSTDFDAISRDLGPKNYGREKVSRNFGSNRIRTEKADLLIMIDLLIFL